MSRLRLDSAQSILMLNLKQNKVFGLRSFRLLERDNYLRDAATALVVEKYELELEAQPDVLGEDEEESPLLKFLQFLIEHQEEIKALIEMIMSLFAGQEKK